jgi:hypothetical protein
MICFAKFSLYRYVAGKGSWFGRNNSGGGGGGSGGSGPSGPSRWQGDSAARRNEQVLKQVRFKPSGDV